MLSAAAGNKILFIGGMHSGQNWWYEPVPADIFDISNNSGTVHYIVPDDPQFTHFRDGAAIASVGNKVLFAGGGDAIGDNQTTQVDIYNATTDAWSKAELSVPRWGLAAATLGNKVFFAGGGGYPGGSSWGEFNTVDIYDNNNNSWSTAALSQPRMEIAATTVDNKIYFAGGRYGTTMSKVIDIYDAAANTWSSSSLQLPRTEMASIAAAGKIFFAAGSYSLGNAGWLYYNNAEILDLNTGATSFTCMLPRSHFSAVRKNNQVIFFTGGFSGDGKQFEIYDTVSGAWSTGVLNVSILGAAIISVNNTVYVAGGTINGNYSEKVWRLEF